MAGWDDAAPPSDAIQAARAGLPLFIGKIPDGQAADYGFKDKVEAESCILGSPYRLHVISPSALSKHKVGDSVESLAAAGSAWYFPIQNDGGTHAVLVVDWMGDHWKAVSLGYAGLASGLDRMRAGAAGHGGGGAPPRLLVVYQASSSMPDLS